MLSVIATNSPVFNVRAIPLFEIPSSTGVPDVVLVRFSPAGLRERTDRSFLLDLTDVRTMLTATSVPRTQGMPVANLADRVGISARHLRSVILPRLADGGHMTRAGDEWRPTHRYPSLATSVVTVEAKLRDWRRGLMQASRHRLAADAAWLAIDSTRSAPALAAKHWFLNYGVGLALVSTDGTVAPVVPPNPKQARSADRELLVERSASIHVSGARSGSVSHVFGRFLSVTTGVDPRL
jgi:hypothetical protein